MKRIFVFGAVAVAVLNIVSCKKHDNSNPIPACLQSSIDSSLALPRESMYVQLDEYRYQGRSVYLFYAGCCDRVNLLFDGNCNYLFAPSGGFTGMGDMSHPNFFTEAVKVTTLWKDPRN